MGDDNAPRVQAAADSEVAAERERLQRRELARQLEEQRATSTPAATAPGRGRVWAAVGAMAVAVAVAWGGFELFGRGDHVSEADKASWAAAWAVAPPQVAQQVASGDVPAALAAMALPAQQQAALQEALDDGRTRLVYLTFTDVVAEDQDRVKVESDGYASEITIWHQTTKVVFPEPASGVVNVTGVYDGGGGITIAITSGETPVNLPFMEVGQVVGIPVVAGP